MANRQLGLELLEKHKDKLKPPYDELVEAIGADAFITTCGVLGGCSVYMPMPDSMIMRAFAIEARNEFDGYNYKELSKKYGVCSRTVQLWVKNKD